MRALSEKQRGSSASLSFRIDDQFATRINDTVDDSTYNLSSLMRAFVVAGFELLDSNNPSIMPQEIEKLWRDLKTVEDERTRRLAFQKYQSEVAASTGMADEERQAMANKIAKLEAMIEQLANQKPKGGNRKSQ